MPGCTAPNCTNSSQKGFKLYHFPSDQERSALWVKNCGREEGWKPTKHTCVCEVHFDEAQFESHRADGLKKLKPYAVPTKFNHLNYQITRKRNFKRKLREEDVIEDHKSTNTVFIVNPVSKNNTDPNTEKISRYNISSIEKYKLLKKSKRQFTTKKMKYLADNFVVQLKKTSRVMKKHHEVTQNSKPVQKNEICFMCNESASNNVSLNSYTSTSNVRLDQKLIQLVAEEFDLLVEDPGVICSTCAEILNFIDYVENVLSTLTKGILNRMKTKFGMKSDDNMDLISYIKSLPALHSFYSDKEKAEHQFATNYTNGKETYVIEGTSPINEDEHTKNLPKDKNMKEPKVTHLECQICSYKTNFKALMVYHLRQHLRSSYSCDFCSSSVAVNSNKVNIDMKEVKMEDMHLLADKVEQNCSSQFIEGCSEK